MYALECGSYDNIICWTPSGLAFVIMDPVSFEKRVLPELFKEAKFASFDRKVSEMSKSFIICLLNSKMHQSVNPLYILTFF
jgi:hypothetical protein